MRPISFRALMGILVTLWLTVPAYSAGTVPGFSLTPQFDLTGKIAPGCKLSIIQAGTVSTPQNAYSDSGLTILLPNPLTCDAAGRLPQWFVADGNIKLRLTTSLGVQIFVGDQLLVIGASSGGGGGSPVDPTTILQTGMKITMYGTGILTGFVRCNGRSIGSATSGATERANADTSALYSFFYGADPNLPVVGGRGVSAAADFAANKALTIPDCRGRVTAGLDDMGNSAAGRLTATYFGASGGCSGALATTLGAGCGIESKTLLTANLPPYTPAGSVTGTATTQINNVQVNNAGNITINPPGGSTSLPQLNSATVISNLSATFTGTAAPGQTSTPFPTVQPTILMTEYFKL